MYIKNYQLLYIILTTWHVIINGILRSCITESNACLVFSSWKVLNLATPEINSTLFNPNGSNVPQWFGILILLWQVVQVLYINSAKVGTMSSGMRWMYYGMVRLRKLGFILTHTKANSLSIPKTHICLTWTQEGAWQTKIYFPYGGLNPSALEVYLNRIIANMEICPKFRPG